MEKKKRRSFSQELKLNTVRRMLSGEKATVLSKELGVHNSILFAWRKKYRGQVAATAETSPKQRKSSVAAAGGGGPRVSMVPYGNHEGTYLIVIGNKTYLGTEVAMVPAVQRKG